MIWSMTEWSSLYNINLPDEFLRRNIVTKIMVGECINHSFSFGSSVWKNIKRGFCLKTHNKTETLEENPTNTEISVKSFKINFLPEFMSTYFCDVGSLL